MSKLVFLKEEICVLLHFQIEPIYFFLLYFNSPSGFHSMPAATSFYHLETFIVNWKQNYFKNSSYDTMARSIWPGRCLMIILSRVSSSSCFQLHWQWWSQVTLWCGLSGEWKVAGWVLPQFLHFLWLYCQLSTIPSLSHTRLCRYWFRWLYRSPPDRAPPDRASIITDPNYFL